MTIPVVIAAGGTGGHLVPALAIADALRRRAEVAVTFVGTERGLERELVSRAGYPVRTTAMRPFGGGARGIRALASMIPATAQARAILRQERARVVVGMGGYASVPVISAARLLRIPALIHEANVVAGLANEMAARLTRHVAVSFQQTLRRFPGARVTGIPLRAAFERFDRAALRDEARAAFGLEPDRTTVLLFGGSIGAARLNAAAAELAKAWQGRTDRQLLVASGRAGFETTRAQVMGDGLLVRVEPFIDRMDLAFAAADVAVCRSGASTVAELAAAGLPAILVPYPHARRREQHANAAALVEPGGAIVLDDAEVSGQLLARVLDDVLGDDARRAAMSKAARSVAHPNAADEIAAWVLRLAAP